MRSLLSILLASTIILSSGSVAFSKNQPIAQELLYNPDHSLRVALADLRTIPPDLQPCIRYLSLYNIPKKDRSTVAKSVSFVVNSLSTRRKIYIPSFVPNSDETLIRLNIDDYEWDKKAWEKLGRDGSGPRAFPEPFFHFFIEVKNVDVVTTTTDLIEITTPLVDVFTGQTKVGQVRAGERFKIEKVVQTDWYQITLPDGKSGFVNKRNCQPIQLVNRTPGKGRQHAQAPWLDTNSVIELVSLTQSEYPILRADWFVVNAILPPAYYDFLKLGNNLKDFENLVFADIAKAEKARLQDKGVVVLSSVARNNRTLTRSNTLANYIWVSHDSFKSVDNRKYAQIILNEQFDATEVIGALPNGLQAYFLANSQGARQDAAPTDIAIDSTAVDKTVRAGRSCMICHSDGIRPIDDEIRGITEMLTNREQVRILAPRREDAYKVADLFGTNLVEVVTRDQQAYQNAVNAATGLDMRVNAANLARLYDDYAETLLIKETVMRETGLPLNELEAFVRSSADNIVLGLIKNPPRAVRRDQWEESFGHFMLLVTTLKKANQGLPNVQKK